MAMKTCLIVEDSALIREIAARIVRELGFEPREASSADDAVALCAQSKPDVVLLDWDLPGLGALDFLRGVGGLEAEARPTIVLCATEHDPQQFALAHAAGVAGHLMKPFDARLIAEKFVELGLIPAGAAQTVAAGKAS
ncbi:response regulator [Amphiplicatus metriothermophilus]|nr:response regulator [Amphiplicatus metriothermophilus]MBB5519157.1 two-component system chemotaxis response regulator CheY [Amphiplicatus metriothermophilus]